MPQLRQRIRIQKDDSIGDNLACRCQQPAPALPKLQRRPEELL